MSIKKIYSTLFKKEFEVKDIIVKDGNLFIMPESAMKAEQTVSEVFEIVKNAHAANVTLNLCNLNMFDALKVATLTAARGLTKNIHNRYEVIVANEVVKSQIRLLSLPNLQVIVRKTIKQANGPRVLAVEV